MSAINKRFVSATDWYGMSCDCDQRCDMEDYRRLEVYQKAVQFARELHGAVARFPFHYRRRLGLQLEDAAESIGSNIAEGCGRKNRHHGNAELIRFLHIAFASACEVQHRLLGARDKKLMDMRTYYRLDSRLTEVKRMLAALIRALDERDRGRQG